MRLTSAGKGVAMEVWLVGLTLAALASSFMSACGP